MKKSKYNIIEILSFIMVLFMMSCSVSQDVIDAYKNGYNSYNRRKYEVAIPSLKYVVDNSTKNWWYFRALYYIGNSYFETHKIDSALIYYHQYLNLANKKKYSEDEVLKYMIPDQSHSICESICSIYKQTNQNDSVLKYLEYGYYKYPYYTFCGNGLMGNDFYYAVEFSRVYMKLGQKQKALEELLWYSFPNEIESNNEIINELRVVLADSKDLVAQFEIALEKSYLKRVNNGSGDITFYYIKFLDVEIRVPTFYYNLESHNNSKLEIDQIRQSDFYKLLVELDNKQKTK